MFLIDHAPQVVSKARSLGSHLLLVAPLVYEVLLQPLPENQAVFRAMSDLIRRHRRHSSSERRLMHEYTASLLFRDGAVPQGMDESLASYTKALLFGQCVDYHKKHPIRSRLQAAA